MTRSEVDHVRRQVEARFFGEALYLGALELARAPTPELHLYLGLAACGAIAASADAQRILHGEPTVHDGAAPLAGNRTLLVYEGFFHLVEAARRHQRVPGALVPIGLGVLADLESYLRDDLKGFTLANRTHTPADAAAGAAALLRRLLPSAPSPPASLASRLRRGSEVVDAALSSSGGDAAFHDIIASR